MCGIFCYVGFRDPVDMCLSGLKRLEYRGYDSSGIAGICDDKLIVCKTVGKIADLEAKIKNSNLKVDLAISHTRWATHGVPTEFNAHPHTDSANKVAIVHNGIIENHDILREKLIAKNVKFSSDTDSEVIAQLLSSVYEGDILKAVQEIIPLLKGSYALAIIHKDHPGKIIGIANGCPLAIGLKKDELFLASDTQAFISFTREVIFIGNSEVAVISSEGTQIYDKNRCLIKSQSEKLEYQVQEVTKESYEHYTLKEIFEQPQSIRNALSSRYIDEGNRIVLEGLDINPDDLMSVSRILILGCGTSWHAGYVAAYMIEDKARIPTQVEISSEFRYKNAVLAPGTLVIAISQSGETADTIAAVRELKAKGAKVLAICNVQGSTLARESDSCLFLRAGPEVGVCSTKAFTSQLVVLSLLTLLLARMRHMSKAEGLQFLLALKMLPTQVQQVLNQQEHIMRMAQKYAHFENFFFIGRGYMYPTALEGALKLKEISYINANGYPAGEMKHGPIALINEQCPTVALCANRATLDKLINNLREVKARKGPILAIIEEEMESIATIADDVIVIPQTFDELASIPTTIVTQLLAYHIAHIRGAEIDQPRNLAKSVTVE